VTQEILASFTRQGLGVIAVVPFESFEAVPRVTTFIALPKFYTSTLSLGYIQIYDFSMTEVRDLFNLQDAEGIAQRLRTDQQLCKENKLPSTLAIELSSASKAFLEKVAWHLTPHSEASKALRSIRYNSIVKGIKAYLSQLESRIESEQNTPRDIVHVPTDHELEATLKVLDYLQKHSLMPPVNTTDPLSDVILTVKAQFSMEHTLRTEQHKSLRKPETFQQSRIRCYICRFLFSAPEAHELYPSLCRQCGIFNIGCSRLSLPEKLNLTGKFALVTGARINLGYSTALRLLRCGANVVVSSRYPADAAARYAKELDFPQWVTRLKIVGADFRTAKDAFRLIHIVKQLLCSWEGETTSETHRNLDILINNAAQTLTDPIKSELKAIAREEELKCHPETELLLASTRDDYQPRVRGGLQASWVPSIGSSETPLQTENEANNDQAETRINHKGLRTANNTEISKSSWVQSLSEIPYEDLISAHSVNAFVPLILCRELLENMGSKPPHSKPQPSAYIVNVSSREGILEDTPGSPSKAGHHVHTNMSKAAINMITETEAQIAWKNRRVAMNTVDPGYMSAAPECQRAEGCPIGFEDGAARVLWPIAVGELEGKAIWGRFLKHFQEGISLTRRG
jgi:NAD(P)-dependent dehydrogenase (short-subunit alcohol dehydrogenase family)